MEGIVSRIYDTRIPLFRQEKEKTVYYLLVLNKQTGAVFSLRKRYSELRTLHEKLEKKIKEYRLDIYLPVFPGRKLIQKTNNNLQKIEGRKSELELYFNDLLKIGKLHSLDLLKEFLPTIRKVLNADRVAPAIPVSEIGSESGFFKSRLSGIFRQDVEQDLLMVSGGEEENRIRVTIERYNYMDDTMYFYVTLFETHSKEEWVYRTRYSTLKRFHETLLDKNLKNYLLKFPSRKLFGITNEDPDSIEKRRRELEEYLDHALSQEPVLNNEYVKYFIEDTKSQYQQFKKQEELKKKKIKKIHEETIRKQVTETSRERPKSQGRPTDNESLKRNILQQITMPDQKVEEGKGEVVIRKKRVQSSPNHVKYQNGLFKTILTIIPEEFGIVYIDN